jgi:hypothetical protein
VVLALKLYLACIAYVHGCIHAMAVEGALPSVIISLLQYIVLTETNYISLHTYSLYCWCNSLASSTSTRILTECNIRSILANPLDLLCTHCCRCWSNHSILRWVSCQYHGDLSCNSDFNVLSDMSCPCDVSCQLPYWCFSLSSSPQDVRRYCYL